MTCNHPSCRQPITRCPDKYRMGSCWYARCTGWVHTATGTHACADKNGEAAPGPESEAA